MNIESQADPKTGGALAEVRICWSRIGLPILVLATMLAVAAPLVAWAWRLGREGEDQKLFLRTYRTPTDKEAFLAYCADYASKSSEDNDVLFAGGSACLSGVQAKAFQRQTGLRAHNLAAITGDLGLAGTAALIGTYLEHHPAPQLIVLCVHPFECGSKVPSGDAADLHRSELADRFYWCYSSDDANDRPSRHDPCSYLVSQGLLIMAGDLVGGQSTMLNRPIWGFSEPSYNTVRAQWIEDRGFYCLGGTRTLAPNTQADRLGGTFRIPDGATLKDPYPVSEQFDRALREIARMAADHGCRLVVRTTPDLPGAELEDFARLRAFFDQLQIDCDNVICDAPEVLHYGPEFFGDAVHLNERGAERFTQRIASKLAEVIARAPGPPDR